MMESTICTFNLAAYMEASSVPPQVQEFLHMALQTCRITTVTPIKLETHLEVEEAAALEALAASTSPSKQLALSCVNLAQ